MARIVLLCVFALSAAVTAAYKPVKWTDLYVKWNMLSYLSYITGHAYFKVPLSTAEARRQAWAQAASSNVTTTWCLQEDPRVCVLYDLQGTVAGMQVSLPVADLQFKGSPYDVTAHPLFMRERLFDMDVFTARYFLVDQETLQAGGRERADELGTGLWLQSGADFINVPRNADDLPARHWTRENCVLEMGRHYYYNISERLPCEDMEPFFLLVDHKKDALHGVGFQTVGQASVKNRKWFESVPASAVRPTLPNAPQCLVDWVAQYGIISLHMYFVDKPWFILC